MEEYFLEKRKEMVQSQILNRGIKDKNIIDAMLKIPRHLFMGSNYEDEAYNDYPLAIGSGQTISQPYVVALMSESLELSKDDKVLEVGTGSGYQTAILAAICKEVYSVEKIKELYESAKKILETLGYDNIFLAHKNGYFGWEEHAPYDKIIVTAAPADIPKPLLDQLKNNGIMVIPVGPTGWNQVLYKVIKKEKDIQKISLGNVAFVPMVQ
jgi:protein-L-isoaspartate(D-aspartate) O-methyltransferase